MVPYHFNQSIATKDTQLQSLKDHCISTNDIMPAILVSRDIDKEVKIYFKRIYGIAPHALLPIDEALEILKKYQNSPVERERKIFSCVIETVYEQHLFIKGYPECKLITIGHLFGGIIEHDLFSSDTGLVDALSIIFNALKTNPGRKMHSFGITALDRFKRRLKDLRQYCAAISELAHFKRFPQHLIEYVEYGKNSQEPILSSRVTDFAVASNMVAPQDPVMPPQSLISQTVISDATTITLPSYEFFDTNDVSPSRPSAANITIINDSPPASTELVKTIINPATNVEDRIAFIFNNLSPDNFQTKGQEILDIITKKILPWLSRYLVTKRVSTENNLHTLYLNLLDYFNSEYLSSLVVSDTYRSIRNLLERCKKTASQSDRSTLNNLGHWLGMITLAKNKTISTDDLNLKTLLVEANKIGQQDLQFTVPFVAKILHSCNMSTIFKPSNPWITTLLNCLQEIYQKPDLKLWLQFEIELLYKNLNIELKDVKLVSPKSPVIHAEIAVNTNQRVLSNKVVTKSQPLIALDSLILSVIKLRLRKSIIRSQ